jgi:hypothetical protein
LFHRDLLDLLHLNSIGAPYGFLTANATALAGFDVIRRFFEITQNTSAIAFSLKAHNRAVYGFMFSNVDSDHPSTPF